MYKDFRSDTVTKPTPEMRKVMAEAEVGDDVYGDDPSVNLLQEYGAGLLGKEAAIFASSGTQTNLLALLTHLARGDEYIVGQDAHAYKYEGGGAAVFGSIQPQPIDFEPDGTLDLAKVETKVKPVNIHFAQTKLLCLENTHNGKVLPMDYQAQASTFAKNKGLAIHLDGARVFNASVKLGVDVKEIAKHFDTVSVCLSKGLGAPVGSLLCGPAEFIERTRRWRKVLGGGMRQAGVLAAAGLYALKHNVARLAQDHAHAALLAEGLAGISELDVLPYSGETNMLFIRLRKKSPPELSAYMRTKGILVRGDRNPIRLVTHLGVGRRDVDTFVTEVKQFFR